MVVQVVVDLTALVEMSYHLLLLRLRLILVQVVVDLTVLVELFSIRLAAVRVLALAAEAPSHRQLKILG